jgi:hypothetical protein
MADSVTRVEEGDAGSKGLKANAPCKLLHRATVPVLVIPTPA